MKKIEKLLREKNTIKKELNIPHAEIVEGAKNSDFLVSFYSSNMVWENAVEMAKAIISLDENITYDGEK